MEQNNIPQHKSFLWHLDFEPFTCKSLLARMAVPIYYLCIRNQNSLIMETREYFEKVMQDSKIVKVVACASIVKMRQWIMTGSLSLRNHIVQISFNQMKTRS